MVFMIKISSFYPFFRLLRVTQEFHEENAVVKMESLTSKEKVDFEYNEVGEISDRFITDNSQLSFSFWTLLIISLLLAIFCRPIYATPILLRVAQIVYIGAFLLHFTALKKNWWIFISDREENTLTFFKQTRRNRDRILQALELIKNKAEKVREISAADPFPAEKPAFEYVYYDIPNMIKTTDRFYENQIIGFEKGMLGENVYTVEYNQLNGNVHRDKERDGGFFTVSVYLFLLTISLLLGFVYGFPELGIGFPQFLRYFGFTLIALTTLVWAFGFQKRERVGLYDKGEHLIYWAYLNKNDKEKMEEIIKFVQSRIPPVTDNDLLKEQP